MKRSLQKKLMIACLMMVFLSSCEWPDRQLQGVDPLKSPIPSAVRFVYEELGNKLREIELYIATDWSGQRYPTAFGTELLVANSNRGEILLTEQAFSATVLTLDRLKRLGVKAVALKHPVPDPSSFFRAVIGLSHFLPESGFGNQEKEFYLRDRNRNDL